MPIIGGIDLGNLTDYLFVFTDGSTDANWQGASKGFLGDAAVNGLVASERTSGTVPYAGTIYTNAATLDAWQAIITDNSGQAFGVTDEITRVSDLEANLTSAFDQINALSPTSGFESVSSTSLDGLDTENGINETFVINVTSAFSVSSTISITGDPGDVFILRWDNNLSVPGYQGQVSFRSGGAIVPLGGLTPGNFIHVAGDINSSGGGANPAPPYPQGPRYDNGQGVLIVGGSDWNGGGFFTGYWLTTGDPVTGETQSLSNGIFVGGWYTTTNKFSMTSGTSGVYIAPNPATISSPGISVAKLVSVDGGITFEASTAPPGPNLIAPTNPKYRFVVTNTGNVELMNITLADTSLGTLTPPTTTLAPGAFFTVDATGTFATGVQCNAVTATGIFADQTVAAADTACYFGVAAQSISIEKAVSVDGGTTFVYPAPPPGPTLIGPADPVYRITVANNGSVPLDNLSVVDSVLGSITIPTTTLPPGEFFVVPVTGTFAEGEQCNTATAAGTAQTETVTASSTACYTGSVAACTVIGYQEVCVDADIAIAAEATPGEPTVACVTEPSINPFGERTCQPSPVPCGFSTQVTLCVAVPVSFSASAQTVAVAQQCAPASGASCLPAS